MTELTDHPDSGRHPVDVGHLVMGLAFLGLVTVWALFQTGVVDTDNVHWLLPLPWLLAGLAGLLAAVGGNRRRRERRRQANQAYDAAEGDPR